MDDFYQEDFNLDCGDFNYNIFSFYKKKNGNNILIDVNFTIMNSNFVLFKLEEDSTNDYYNILISTYVKDYGKSIKNNLKIQLKRFLELKENKLKSSLCFNLDFINYIIICLEEEYKLDFDKDINFNLFLYKIFLQTLKNILIKSGNNFSFLYCKRKLICLIEDFLLNTKNLIRKYYN